MSKVEDDGDVVGAYMLDEVTVCDEEDDDEKVAGPADWSEDEDRPAVIGMDASGDGLSV